MRDQSRWEWEAKSPEERIAGRLAFWLKSRRAELLAELAAAGGAP